MMADFGVQVIPTSGGAFLGVFDDDHIAVGDVPVDSSAPSLMCMSSDVTAAGITAGAELQIDGAAYVVRSVQPDGTGVTMLRLEAL